MTDEAPSGAEADSTSDEGPGRASYRSVLIARVRVDLLDANATLREVEKAAGDRCGIGVHFVNAYTLALADRDARYRSVLAGADLNLPDGRPLAWAGRKIDPQANQLCGPDFMLHAFKCGKLLKHYLYGSTPETIQHLTENLAQSFPQARIAGSESPPFRALTDGEKRALAERVSASGANIMWVGLGTPKQDRFVEEMKHALAVPLVAVGAAFDFHAGLKSRAPRWVRAAGLEWVFRLLSEPRRLWRRYLFGNARFIWTLLRDGVRPTGEFTVGMQKKSAMEDEPPRKGTALHGETHNGPIRVRDWQ